jgi:uncharacterized protein YndB with AHSA1/START domain
MTDTKTTQIYRVYINATPQAIWDAIVKPEWTAKYGYGGNAEFDLRPGGAFRVLATDEIKKSGADQGYVVPDLMVDGEVLEADPPRRLVQTWRMAMDPGAKAEGFTRLTYEIDETQGSGTKLTVIHEVGDAKSVAAMIEGAGDTQSGGGGWPWILSDLKTLLETGTPLVQH